MKSKFIYIEGPKDSGKSEFVASVFYPLEDIKITASVDMSSMQFEQDFTTVVLNEKKYINVENFTDTKANSVFLALLDTCLENDQLLFLTSREAPPDWIKDKIIHLKTTV